MKILKKNDNFYRKFLKIFWLIFQKNLDFAKIRLILHDFGKIKKKKTVTKQKKLVGRSRKRVFFFCRLSYKKMPKK